MHLPLDSTILRKDEYRPLYSGGSFIVGQEQDGRYNNEEKFDPLLDPKQGFSGRITQVEIWNIVLTVVEIKKIANCITSTLRPQNRVVTWEHETILQSYSQSKIGDAWFVNKANILSIPLENLCQKNIISNQFIWPRISTYVEFTNYCNTMNAIPPIIYQRDQWEKVHNDMLDVFNAVNETFPSAFRDNGRKSGIRCFSKTNDIDFWVGNERNPVNGDWKSEFDPTGDFSKFDVVVSSLSANCIYNFAGNPKPSNCHKKFPCGICKVSQNHMLYMKGICEKDLDLYDTEYYVYGVKNNRPYFV